MGNRYASGKNAIAMCDRCGQRFRLTELKTEIIKTKRYNLLVCKQCWDPDQPQLQLGMYPVDDPQALRNPRPDSTYVVAGTGSDGYLTAVAGSSSGAGTRWAAASFLMLPSRLTTWFYLCNWVQ